MNYKKPEKPETQKAQIDAIWNFLFNHLAHRVSFQDVKINFILALLAIVLALMTIVIVRGG